MEKTWECPHPLSLSTLEYREPMVSSAKELAGLDAIECGLVGLGDVADGAFECVEAHLSNDQRAFWMARQGESWDSEVWDAVVRDGRGEVFVIRYDSDPSGGAALDPRLEKAKCSGIKIFRSQKHWLICE